MVYRDRITYPRDAIPKRIGKRDLFNQGTLQLMSQVLPRLVLLLPHLGTNQVAYAVCRKHNSLDARKQHFSISQSHSTGEYY